MTIKQSFIEARDVARLQLAPFLATALLLFAVYLMSTYIKPGLLTYALSIPPSLFVIITALARLNDIGVERLGLSWHVRRAGLILTGCGVAVYLGSPFGVDGVKVSWGSVIMMWGIALTWATTEGMPPWWAYITGQHKQLGADGESFSHSENFFGKKRRTGEKQRD